MTTTDFTFTKLTRKQLMAHFEQERQAWLTEGMSEADIFRIHFGEEAENGRGGDYRAWLNERRHTRPDHKYALGAPVAIAAVDPDGAWIGGGRRGQDDLDFGIDLDAALSEMPSAQRELVSAILFAGMTSAEYARAKGINKSVVSRTLGRAKKYLKNFYTEGN